MFNLQSNRKAIALAYAPVSIALLLLGIFLFERASRQDVVLQKVSECVELLAKHQGFSGTPKEKWDFFAPNCLII